MYLKYLEKLHNFFASKQIRLPYKHMPGKAWLLSLNEKAHYTINMSTM